MYVRSECTASCQLAVETIGSPLPDRSRLTLGMLQPLYFSQILSQGTNKYSISYNSE